MSLVFYDTETTGLETAFDQILQFAAIRTDADLNEIERFEVRCRLQPHIVPAPGAMLVTKVRPAQLDDTSLVSHYEMIREIRAKLLSWSPATFIGYNSIGFDEHLLRQALYQTLHHPYLTNSKGNTRTDVMRIVQACARFAPDSLAIPAGEKGQLIFKLDEVAPLNGFEHDRAHDAMGDAEATIFLSRLLKGQVPDLWSAAMRFGQKAAAIDYVQSETLFCYGEIYFGKSYAWTVTGLGVNEANSSDFLVFDVSVDPANLIDLDDGELAKRLTQSPKPVRSVKINAAPIFLPFPDVVAATSAHGIETAVLEERAAFFDENPNFRERLIERFLSGKVERGESPHVEEQIYTEFTSESDMELLEQFHAAPWNEREAILGRLSDHRLRELGLRLIFFERPEVLAPKTSRKLENWMSERLLGRNDVPWLTLNEALNTITSEMHGCSVDERTLLSDHRRWLQDRVEDVRRG